MKKIQTITFLAYIAAGVGLVLTSCVGGGGIYDPYIVDASRQKENYYAAPAAQNVPLLSEKNQLSFSGNYSASENREGSDWHAAFTPGKHFGLTSGYSFSKESHTDYVKNRHFELGGGYFKKLNPYCHFETYGGFGLGNTKNIHHTGQSNIKTNNFFVQPAIALTNKKNTVQFAFVSRVSMNHFEIGDTSFNNDREPIVTNQMRLINDQPSHIFWEPALVFRTGWENILFQASYSISNDLSGKEFYRSKNNFSVGVLLRGSTAKKK